MKLLCSNLICLYFLHKINLKLNPNVIFSHSLCFRIVLLCKTITFNFNVKFPCILHRFFFISSVSNLSELLKNAAYLHLMVWILTLSLRVGSAASISFGNVPRSRIELRILMRYVSPLLVLFSDVNDLYTHALLQAIPTSRSEFHFSQGKDKDILLCVLN